MSVVVSAGEASSVSVVVSAGEGASSVLTTLLCTVVVSDTEVALLLY